MKCITFITGGVRSGKSRFARNLVESWPDPLVYVATAEVWDAEMGDRVRRHREDRGPRWATVEEPLHLSGALDRVAGAGGVLLDCLTVWTANLLGNRGHDPGLPAAELTAFWKVLGRFPGRLCIVSNEVGSDMVPDNPLAREFRDLVGRVNRGTAARANQVFAMFSGLPLRLK